MEGMSETVQLAGVAANFSAELMRVGMEGTNILFKGAEGISRGVYALIRMGLRQSEAHAKDPTRFHRGSYEMNDMMSMCTRKGVTPGFMRISSSAYEEFLSYAKDNKLAYCVLPDLNTYDGYIEIMYPSTQQVQFVNFQNNINKRQAVTISFEDYINGADAEHQADMEEMINSLSEEEKEILKNKTETAGKDGISSDEPEPPYEKEINVYDDQVVIPDRGDMAQIVLVDGKDRECCLSVPMSALTKTDAGYTVKLNAKEQIKYTAAVEISVTKDMIAKETSGQYIVTVPGTHAECFVAFDKRICSSHEDGITVFINQGEKYQMLDRTYTFMSEVTGRKLYGEHFNGQMITADKIEEYNDNYHVREGRLDEKCERKSAKLELSAGSKEEIETVSDVAELENNKGKEDKPRHETAYSENADETKENICDYKVYTAEVDLRMIGESRDGVTDINMTDGSTVSISSDDIIKTKTPSGEKYFACLAPDNYFLIPSTGTGGRCINNSALISLIHTSRAELLSEDRKIPKKKETAESWAARNEVKKRVHRR